MGLRTTDLVLKKEVIISDQRLFVCSLRPKPDALPEIYTTLGQDYDDRVINISV